MDERIIVTLTTWHKRIDNIPSVLDTIYAQTMPPDLIVLNLAYNEIVPKRVQDYIEQHGIGINRVPDTKVFKKLIPTLKKYPEDCVISIDDDWLYPKDMIADFIDVHTRYPNNPISGNKVVIYGMQCHCGCASFVKAEYFGQYLDMIDDEVMVNCPSDDMVYTYLCTLAGHPYYRTIKEYYTNMEPYGADESYSDAQIVEPIGKTYVYMNKRFGRIGHIIKSYISDRKLCKFIEEIETERVNYLVNEKEKETEDKIYSSYSFRLGQAIVKPVRRIKNLFK